MCQMKAMPKGKFDFRNVSKNIISKDGKAIAKRLK